MTDQVLDKLMSQVLIDFSHDELHILGAAFLAGPALLCPLRSENARLFHNHDALGY